MYAIPMHKMELKVWVEGIQRVICGVTESTTCQDVVIALAHATGKTGRFTLVERWRDNERLLAPTEPPLRVLHKWGEYACDVQFILRHSDKERHRRGGSGSGSSRGGGGSSSLDQGSKRTEKFLHNFTPHGSGSSGVGGGVYHQQRRSSGSSIRKSLTFSGAHTFFPPMKSSSTSQAPASSATAKPSASSVNPGKALASNGPVGSSVRHSENSSMESLDESASFSSSSSPYASLDKQRRQYAVNRSALGSGSNSGGSLERKVVSSGGGLRPSPRRSPRPAGLPVHEHHGHHSPHKTSPQPNQHVPHSVPQPPMSAMPHNTTTSIRSSPYKDSNSKGDMLHTSSNNNNNIAKVVGTPHEYNLDQGLHHKAQTTSPSHCISPQPPAQYQQASSPRDVTKHNGTLPNAGVSGDTPPTSPGSKKDELLRLVRLQQERLGVQDSQLKILDSEILYWEGREQDFDQQYQTVQEETSRLQETERSLDNSLQELDLVSWVDKLEIEKQQEKMLQSELTLIRSQIANAESELLAVQSKMPGLSTELKEERRKQVSHQEENKEQEIKMLQEISDLQKQINKKLMQYEQNSGSLEQLGIEVKSLESAILEKKTQIADWEKELRSVNMDFFVHTPSTDWLKPPADQGKDKAHGRLSPSRPGSTRKMLHNPQLLKETVATTKNPHGMWV